MTDRQRKIAALQKEQALWEEFVATKQAQQLQQKRGKKPVKKQKTPEVREFENICYGAIILFFVGYYFLRH